MYSRSLSGPSTSQTPLRIFSPAKSGKSTQPQSRGAKSNTPTTHDNGKRDLIGIHRERRRQRKPTTFPCACHCTYRAAASWPASSCVRPEATVVIAARASAPAPQSAVDSESPIVISIWPNSGIIRARREVVVVITLRPWINQSHKMGDRSVRRLTNASSNKPHIRAILSVTMKYGLFFTATSVVKQNSIVRR